MEYNARYWHNKVIFVNNKSYIALLIKPVILFMDNTCTHNARKVVQNLFYLSSLFIGRTFTYTFNHTGVGIDSMDTDGKEESVTGV